MPAEIKASSVANKHPEYIKNFNNWAKIRHCLDGEDVIKAQKETYLPRPGGMTGEYADAYDAYIERAHFPLIASYALSGALGIVITKLPEFNVPKELEYIIKEATKDGRSIKQLFIDVIIEILETGRVPLLVDVIPDKNEFRFVQYKAEDFINWKTAHQKTEQNLIVGVLTEAVENESDIFSHEDILQYRVLSLDENGKYNSRIFNDDQEDVDKAKTPNFMGKELEEIPLYVAGSINNSFDVQPIPLISVANCSVQIYRKEADLANSEFLSCNPTLCLVGASNDDDLPNVVGSSVMIVIPNEQARIFYTTTDTAALKHVKTHIDDLYEEAIRHGVSILDNRKGVESAEALRIRQSTQSASIYSVYLAALNAIRQGLVTMCKWGGYNEDEVILDAPASLTLGLPDSSVLKEVIEGFGKGVIPLPVIHKYLVSSGLIDQTVGYEDYLILLKADKALREETIKLGGEIKDEDIDKGTTTKTDVPQTIKKEAEGSKGQA